MRIGSPSDPWPWASSVQVVKVAPDFLWNGAVSLARRWQEVAGDEDRETRTDCFDRKEAVRRPRLSIAFLRFPSLHYEHVVAACKLYARLYDYDLELRNVIRSPEKRDIIVITRDPHPRDIDE